MSLFKHKNPAPSVAAPSAPVAPAAPRSDNSALAEIALRNIQDGVLMVARNNVIEFINPAAAAMLGYSDPHDAVGLDCTLLIKIETKEGRELSDQENPFLQALATGQNLDKYKACLISGAMTGGAKRIPVAISVLPVQGAASRIVTLRDITKELAEEGEQTEFISTASHEMRTPVATIDGYLSLCLNPQTATIDDRARGYLTSAHAAAEHLGHLFQNLLDVTKLDDGRLRPEFVPVELVSTVKQIADGYLVRARDAKIAYQFGASTPDLNNTHRMEQVVYGSVDLNFLREIMDNLIDNALKYTPAGGSVYINVLGDGDRALINVTDTGMGISADDLGHIFQKFYRADNSDTRTIGGTGLGLYLVKQRAEAMGGRVWAESAFGEGTTFYVSLPRLTGEEYERRSLALRNNQMMGAGQMAVSNQMAMPNQMMKTPQPEIAPAAGVPPAGGGAWGTPIESAGDMGENATTGPAGSIINVQGGTQ